MTQAAILVGGRGTRLGALTASTPKPLLEVGGVPFLDHVIAHLRDRGCGRFLLLAGFEAMQVVEYARAADSRLGVPIYVAIEPVPDAGTGGALWHARRRLDETFILANGDTFFDVDPRCLLNALNQRLSILATMARIANGKNGGLYALRHEVTRYLEPISSLEAVISLPGRCGSLVFDDYFIDIGTPVELERARRELPLRNNDV